MTRDEILIAQHNVRTSEAIAARMRETGDHDVADRLQEVADRLTSQLINER